MAGGVTGGAHPPGALVVCGDAAELAHETALRMERAIHRAVRERGRAIVALSGGSTPMPAYALLAAEGQRLAAVEWLLADERCVPLADERSNFGAISRALFAPARVHEARRHPVNTDLPPHEAAADYEARIRSLLGLSPRGAPGDAPAVLDLVVAGVGVDGHTASLFPGRGSVAATDALVVAVSPGRGLEPRVSLSRNVLVAARTVLVLASGAAKRSIVEEARRPGSEDDVPARIFLGAPAGTVTWLVDREASPGEDAA